MARIIPVGYGEAAITVLGAVGTQPYVTTMGVSLIGVDPADYVAVANAIHEYYKESFTAPTSNACTIDSCTLAVGLAGGTSGSVVSTTPAVNGGNAGNMAPSAMAIVARKVTADLGRKGRGRAFLPCMLDEGSVNEDGSLITSALNDYGALWNTYILNLATSGVGFASAPVLLHADGSQPTPLLGGSIAPLVGWIRKRIR